MATDRPNRYSATHRTCEALAVVSWMGAMSPKQASTASRAASATAWPKSCGLAPAPNGSCGWISGRTARLRAAYQSSVMAKAMPAAAVSRMARSGAMRQPSAAWPKKLASSVLKSRAACMPSAPAQKGSGPPSSGTS